MWMWIFGLYMLIFLLYLYSSSLKRRENARKLEEKRCYARFEEVCDFSSNDCGGFGFLF